MKDIKKLLKSGMPAIGTWLQIPNSSTAEIMGKSGYDWIAVDLEHAAFSVEILPDIFRAIELGGTFPMARVAQNSEKDIKQALDSGALGIIIPMIQSADELSKGIRSAKYPPEGIRGIGFSRANLSGKNFSDYFQGVNERVIVIAQIENIRAVESIDRILEVPGLNGIIIGPYDLSGSMGITGDFENPLFKSALAKIAEAAKKKEIPMGIHIVNPDEKLLKEKIKDGYQFIAYGIDSVFLYTSAICPEIN